MKNLENSIQFQSDKRQVGALLMMFGFMAVVQPLSQIAAGFGNNGTSFFKNGQYYPIWLLIGLLCNFFTGVASTIIGYLATVHDWSHKALTICLLVTMMVRRNVKETYRSVCENVLKSSSSIVIDYPYLVCLGYVLCWRDGQKESIC